MTHDFDAAVALTPQADGTWLGHTSYAYANMVGPYGGITAAQALNAVMRHPERLGEPVAFTVNYAAALADGPFTVLTRAARTNRSTQHWIVEVRQQGEAVLTGTVFTALRRETWAAVEHRMPAVPPPGDVPETIRSRVTEWTRRYEMRLIDGGFPPAWDGTEDPSSLTRLWVRDRPARTLDFPSLAALSDVFFPGVWRRRATMVPIGTVSMTIYFHADTAQLAAIGDGYLLGQARSQVFNRGYFDQTAQLWNEAGEMLVTTHQVVYYKE